MTKIKPLFDRLVIKQIQEKQETDKKFALILPESAQERPLLAEVIEAGDGTQTDGKSVKMQVKKGDKVLYSKYAAIDFKLNGETVAIIRQSDILAIVE